LPKTFIVEKGCPNILASTVLIFKNCPKENNRPNGENYFQSGRPVRVALG
jgi:hypothetical protein